MYTMIFACFFHISLFWFQIYICTLIVIIQQSFSLLICNCNMYTLIPLIQAAVLLALCCSFSCSAPNRRRDFFSSAVSTDVAQENGDKQASIEKWKNHFETSEKMKRYVIIAAPGMEEMAERMQAVEPNRFLYLQDTMWNKFPDGTDNIEIGGFHPTNRIAGQNVLFLSSFHNNEVTLSQFSVMITLLQSFIESLTVVLPFYPVGTMERVIKEGQVATANTYAQMFSNLPTCGKPTRLVVYDLHTLQNR